MGGDGKQQKEKINIKRKKNPSPFSGCRHAITLQSNKRGIPLEPKNVIKFSKS